MTRSTPSSNGPFRFVLDPTTGVPVYRQLIDQITSALAAGALHSGAQLPTVRQVAVDLAINPNTVLRAYRELEIRGVLDTQQGTGTFVAERPASTDTFERERRLDQFVSDVVARAGASGFTVQELLDSLNERLPEGSRKRD